MNRQTTIEKQFEKYFEKYNMMVHLIKEFAPNQAHKLTYEDQNGEDKSVMFVNIGTLDQLEEQINRHFKTNNIESSEESDLIINYK